ncbi:unnamed protein product [Sympodiomycopsis kandeliae]
MVSQSLALPVVAGLAMPYHPTELSTNTESAKNSSPASLPSFAQLAVHCDASAPGSPISPTSASSADLSRGSSNSMDASESFNSEEGLAGEAMDTQDISTDMRDAPVGPPTWTSRWSGRAPPPKPLLRSTGGYQARRHHPYGAPLSGTSSRTGAGTPSPTWPAHGQGYNGRSHVGAPPHTAGFFDSVPSPQRRQDSRLKRLRSSTTVILPPLHGDHDATARRPVGPPRTSSYGGYGAGDERERPNSGSSASVMFENRRSRGDSLATTDSWNSYPSTHPSSPLLFQPLTPNEPFHPGHVHAASPQQPGHAAQKAHLPGQIQHSRFAFAPPSVHSPHLLDRHQGNYEESPKGGSTLLAPHDRRMQPPQHPNGHFPSAHGTVEQWRGVVGPAVHVDGTQHMSPQQQQHPTLERISQARRRRRPPFSYSSLIGQAIRSSPQCRMTLREIYTWISNSYPRLYSMDGPDSQGWQNTVRHNLSLNKSFVKVARTTQDIYDSCASSDPAQSQAARGKGGWWTIDPASAHTVLGPNFGMPGGENSPTEAHPDGRPSSAGAYSEGEYFPSPVHTPSAYGNADPNWPRSLPGSGSSSGARRDSSESVHEQAALASHYPPGYPSVLMQARARPSSMDQGQMLGYDQCPPSFSRSRGYSTSGFAQDGHKGSLHGPPQRLSQQHQERPFFPHGASTHPTVPIRLPPVMTADAAPPSGHYADAQKLEVSMRAASVSDRDLTPKAVPTEEDTELDVTPRASEGVADDESGERSAPSGRMAISDILC